MESIEEQIKNRKNKLISKLQKLGFQETKNKGQFSDYISGICVYTDEDYYFITAIQLNLQFSNVYHDFVTNGFKHYLGDSISLLKKVEKLNKEFAFPTSIESRNRDEKEMLRRGHNTL